MQGFTFIFSVLLPFFLLFSSLAIAQERPAEEIPNPEQSEREDFEETPYTSYAEFDEEEEEENAQIFFQTGRFFGVSLGAGGHGSTGNRAKLWRGGFPAISVRIHYWFDLNFALQMEFLSADHTYDFRNNGDTTSVNITRLGLELKYYIPTQDLPAAFTFATPYFLGGAGTYRKSETTSLSEAVDQNDVFGFSAGTGLEFLINPKRTYFALEARAHLVNYDDRFTARFQPELEDLQGVFYSFVASLMFTY